MTSTWGDDSLLPPEYFEDMEVHDSVDAFIAAVHGDNQIVDDNGTVWGIVGSRHGMSAYVRVRERRQLRAPFRFLWAWRHGIACLVLGAALLYVLGVRP